MAQELLSSLIDKAPISLCGSSSLRGTSCGSGGGMVTQSGRSHLSCPFSSSSSESDPWPFASSHRQVSAQPD